MAREGGPDTNPDTKGPGEQASDRPPTHRVLYYPGASRLAAQGLPPDAWPPLVRLPGVEYRGRPPKKRTSREKAVQVVSGARVSSSVVSDPTRPFALVAPQRRQRRRDFMTIAPEVEFVSTAEVVGWLGLSRSTLHRLRAAGDFPEPLQISRRRVAYRVAHIRAWLAREDQRGARTEVVPQAMWA